MTTVKVFVGNLSFQTKEADLAKAFEVAGKVINANIITRGPRSLGYGFVELEDDQTAQNAVKLLDKKEVEGRIINVEVAKEREEVEKSTEGQDGAPRGGLRSRGRGAKGRARGRGGQQAQGGETRAYRVKSEEGGEEGKGEEEGGEPRARRQRKPRAPRKPESERPPRRERVPDEQKEQSKDTLFVANLPFSLDDEAFGALWSERKLAFKKAHVVKKRNGRSKGYGFVEFENTDAQQKALAEKITVQDRELSLKVAYFVEQSEEQTPEAAEGKTAEKKEGDK